MSMSPDEPQPHPQPESPVAFELPAPSDNGDKKILAESAAELQKKLEDQKETHQERMFLCFVGMAILVCPVLFGAVDGNFGAFLAMFLLLLVLLIGLANHLGVDWAVKLIGWVLYNIRKHIP